MALRVFISHSSKSAYASAVRDGVARELAALGHEVLLDKQRLEPGDAWRAKLHEWLAICDAAVILFSRDAVGSEWVLKEATILTWRQALQPSLLVIPALLGDVTPADTCLNGFRPLGVNEIQFARLDPAAPQDARALVGEIVAKFAGAAPVPLDSALQDWLLRVKVCLKKVDPDDLTAASKEMKIDASDWPGTFEARCERLAWHILCSGLGKVLPALRRLRNSMPADQLQRFGDLVLPTWVPEEVARGVLPATKMEESRRFVAVNTQFGRIAEHYVQRATCCAPDVTVVGATGVTGESGQAETLSALDKAFRRALNVPANRPPEYLRYACQRQPQPFFALVGNGALTPGVLPRLPGLFPGVTFVLVSGLQFPDAVVLGLPHLERILPALDAAREMEADVTISDARTALELGLGDET